MTGKHSVLTGPDTITLELANIYAQRSVAEFQISTVPIDDPNALARIKALQCQLDRLILLENRALRRMKRQEAND
jgi:hypothetical protein